MLELNGIRLEREGKEILRDLTAVFEDSKIYAILGNNGVGKSTLAYTVMGLESYRMHEGDIFLDGDKLNGRSVTERARLGITLVWQEPARFDGLSIREYLTLGSKNHLSKSQLEEILKSVGLSEGYLERFVDASLSGGERKRVELASVLILKPRVVMLDEPDSGIDIISTKMIEDVLNAMKGKGATVIVITHREEIARMADEAYLMCSGSFLKQGRSDEIVDFYRTYCDTCDHVNKPEEGDIGA